MVVGLSARPRSRRQRDTEPDISGSRRYSAPLWRADDTACLAWLSPERRPRRCSSPPATQRRADVPWGAAVRWTVARRAARSPPVCRLPSADGSAVVTVSW